MPSDWRPFVLGGTASVIAECGTFPIDTTKTRLQIQGQKIDGQAAVKKYRGASHALYRISIEEGVSSLYKGLNVAVLRQASYGTLKIGVYQSMKGLCPENNFLSSIICGVTAGVVSAALANPTDIVKVRFQARNQHFQNTANISDAFLSIYRNEGIKGLWRGVVPTTQRAAVICGVKLPVYDKTKNVLLTNGLVADGAALHFTASFIAGLTGSVVSNPIDVIKTRLMNQCTNIRPQPVGAIPMIYTSSLDCLMQTVRFEGIPALWKGFTANWMRLGPWNIIFFMSYERLMKLSSL